MKTFISACILLATFLVCLEKVVGQGEGDAIDETHQCQMFRQCKDCYTLEYCVKYSSTLLQRWWIDCPTNTPYCNPYSQTCESNITEVCNSIING